MTDEILQQRAIDAMIAVLPFPTVGECAQMARAIIEKLASLPSPILLTTAREMNDVEAMKRRLASELEACGKAENERDDLRLLLIRKNEALSVFASEAMWITATAFGPRMEWNGDNEYRNPMAFARREAEAEARDDREGRPTQ